MESLHSNRGFHGLCGSLTRSGLGVFYCVPSGNPDVKDLDKLNWALFSYQNEGLLQIDAERFFSLWQGRGRAGQGKPWDEHVKKRYNEIDSSLLEPLVLNQVFYNSFFKKQMQKPAADPYDVDCFFVSYEGKIFPVEIKETRALAIAEILGTGLVGAWALHPSDTAACSRRKRIMDITILLWSVSLVFGIAAYLIFYL